MLTDAVTGTPTDAITGAFTGAEPTESRRRFEGAVAVVTGGSKGIGLAIASRLAREGACVAINARPGPPLQHALRLLEQDGADALAVPGDITQPGVVESVVEAAHTRFGRVTHVVQNAAVSPHFGPLLSISHRDLEQTLVGNAWPALALVKAALAAGMEEARGAAVIISSIGARLTNPTIAAYDAAKAALNSLVRALARELGTRCVRLNLVSPGLIATPSAQVVLTEGRDAQEAAILPLQRVGRPEDIAGAVAFLLSEDASYITGSDLVVDGGRLLVGGETVDLFGVHDPERIQGHLDAVGRAFATQSEAAKAGAKEGGQ
jgi:NAD(P)-dependent dehydrogenase (short-subunit alcohol dehydrogenase family)